MRRAVVVLIALVVAAGVGLLLHGTLSPASVQSAGSGTSGSDTTGTAHGARAAVLRRQAREACDSQSWQTCLDKLNAARTLDPGGEEATGVQALRQAAGERAR